MGIHSNIHVVNTKQGVDYTTHITKAISSSDILQDEHKDIKGRAHLDIYEDWSSFRLIRSIAGTERTLLCVLGLGGCGGVASESRNQ
ncbi:hypothetical protein TNCV_2539231 [Trichonephila clavipes]|nr:hypothetical protein TNCV_2539231 [Trichonephila clavipes]